jgi:2-oxoglutarate dehydrogenase E2 component (dihydrolipoamide succinyltransferase)
MTVLLEKIRAEIGVRLQESRAAVDEYERLEAALAALGGPIRARRLKPAEPAAEAPAADAAPAEDSPPAAEAAPAAEPPPAPAEPKTDASSAAPSLRAVAAPAEAAEQPPDAEAA